MTIEKLSRANAVKKTVEKLESDKSRISKLYSKKEDLTNEDIEELIQIAMVNTDYTLKAFRAEFAEL
tara:strand:+ start:790 stop:990 length:201 start_codon:yes stop_codon:yes gene_type:complete